jgi:hypothetical protein
MCGSGASEVGKGFRSSATCGVSFDVCFDWFSCPYCQGPSRRTRMACLTLRKAPRSSLNVNIFSANDKATLSNRPESSATRILDYKFIPAGTVHRNWFVDISDCRDRRDLKMMINFGNNFLNRRRCWCVQCRCSCVFLHWMWQTPLSP